jgi:hypothetical protein
MKQITVSRTVFTLDELSENARNIALEKMCAYMHEWIDGDQIAEYLNGELLTMLTGECVGEISSKELTKRTGLKMEWSLSRSQGDGVAIYGEIYAKDAPKLIWHNADNARLTRNGYGNYYTHYNTFDVTVCGEDENGNYTTLDGDAGEAVTEQFRDICRQLARLGYQHIEWLTGEEEIENHLDCHGERRFTEDGDIIHASFWSDK